MNQAWHAACAGSKLNRPDQRFALEPLPQLDAEAVRVADLRPRIGVADDRSPDDIDALLPQFRDGLVHVVDFERHHAVAEMLQFRRRVDRGALIGDQLDDRPAQIQIDEIERGAGPLDAVARLDPEAQHLGVEPFRRLRLAATADAFIQNYRPGVVERLGIGEEAIRAVAPKIVYVSISGFGEKGPYAQKPVYDPLIQGFSGLATVQAGSDEARPRMLRTILPDKLTATTTSQAITAALLARERTGEGQHLPLSMLEAG